MTRTARIIMVESCEQCPHLSVEEVEKKEYTQCWAMMKNIKDVYKIHSDCPLEEIDIEDEMDGEFDD